MPSAHFVRHALSLSADTIGTDALNAMSRIRGVTDPQIVEESDDHVIVSYEWDAHVARPPDPESHFREFGLQKVADAT